MEIMLLCYRFHRSGNNIVHTRTAGLSWYLQNCDLNYHSFNVTRTQTYDSDLMMTSSYGNIFRVTGPLCGWFTGYRWIPLIKASDAELWFFVCSWKKINDWINNGEAGDLRRHRTNYDVIVMLKIYLWDGFQTPLPSNRWPDIFVMKWMVEICKFRNNVNRRGFIYALSSVNIIQMMF